MADLFDDEANKQLAYWDRTQFSTFEAQLEARKSSRTVYVGNLSFHSGEERLRTVMSNAGHVTRVIMGVNKFTYTPCGFCFVEFASVDEARAAVAYLNGTKCDGRIIKVELDGGFVNGRQFGRGKAGGQPRDERRGGALDAERVGPIPPSHPYASAPSSSFFRGHQARRESQEPQARPAPPAHPPPPPPPLDASADAQPIPEENDDDGSGIEIHLGVTLAGGGDTDNNGIGNGGKGEADQDQPEHEEDGTSLGATATAAQAAAVALA